MKPFPKLHLGARGRKQTEDVPLQASESEESDESDDNSETRGLKASERIPLKHVLDVDPQVREVKVQPFTTFRYKEKGRHAKTQDKVRIGVLLSILVILLVVAYFQRAKLRASFTLGSDNSSAPVLSLTPRTRSHPYCLLDNDESYWTKTKLFQAQHPPNCSHSKFFVVRPGNQGFGTAILSLTSVLRTWHEKGWVVVLAPRFSHGFWYFPNASECPNRGGDAWTCYFRPITNCTLDDVYARAGVSSLEEAPQYGNAKPNATVIVFSGYKALKPYTDAHKKSREGYNFPPVVNSKNAFYLRYLLRLNNETNEKLVESFERIPRVDPKISLSLPIRASERCGHPLHGKKPGKLESGCLALETYLELIKYLQAELHRPIEKVLVTSEDERYIRAAKERPELWSMVAPVFNELDTHPGTSRLVDVPNTTHWTQLVSMFTTLEFLLQSDVFVLNCASHFHLLLALLRISDCPARATRSLPQMHCLDSQSTPTQFQICNPTKDHACEAFTKRVMSELSE